MNIGFRNRKKYGTLTSAPLGIIMEEKDLGAIVCQNLKVGKECFKVASKGSLTSCWGWSRAVGGEQTDKKRPIIGLHFFVQITNETTQWRIHRGSSYITNETT